MRYNSFRDPSRAAADGGLFDSELVLKPPPPYTPEPVVEDAEEEVLRLAPLRDEAEPPAKRRRGPSRRALVLSGWALALTVALSAGYFIQTGRQPLADADAPPAVAAPPDAVGAPVTAPPITSDPDRFTQAEAAPEVNPPSADPPPQVAEATPATPLPAVGPAAPAADPVAPKVREPARAVVAEADEDSEATPVKAKAPERPKAAKVETAKAETAAAKSGKAADPAKVAQTKDLPQLKARMSRAYAQALKAGTPKTVLRARQTEWATLYARAEKKGPAAVAALYRTRAAQLEAIARKSAKAHAKV